MPKQPLRIALLALATLLLGSGQAVAVDLTVSSVDTSQLDTDSQTLTATGVVSASVENLGELDAGPFSVLFFEDRDGSGSFEPAVDLELGTADETNIAGLGDFVAAELPEIERWELLAYSNLGQPKYGRLDLPYALEGVPLLTRAEMEALHAVAVQRVPVAVWSGATRLEGGAVEAEGDSHG